MASVRRCHSQSSFLDRSFAWAATILMVLIVFQVAAENPGSATGSRLSIDDRSTLGGTGGSNVTENSLNLNHADNATPAHGPQPGGGVESYAPHVQPTISTVETPGPSSMISGDTKSVIITGNFGTYVFNRTNPAVFSLLSPTGAPIVMESCFVLQSSLVLTAPSGEAFVSMSGRSLVMEYGLVTVPNPAIVVGRMQLRVDLPDSGAPKFTASVLQTSFSYEDWSVVWQIRLPTDTHVSRPLLRELSTPLADLPRCTVLPLSKLVASIECGYPSDQGALQLLRIDWSDAKEGLLRIMPTTPFSGRPSTELQVEFAKGRAVIDPTIVVSPGSTAATSVQSQRKVFWYSGNYWLFYSNGINICFGQSVDGNKWTTQVIPGCDPLAYPSYGFDVSERDGKIVVGWIGHNSTGNWAMCDMGMVLGSKIQWYGQYGVYASINYPSWISVAIGTDYRCWMAVKTSVGAFSYARWQWTPGTSFSMIGSSLSTFNLGNNEWYTLLPIANGNIVLLETSSSGIIGNSSCSKVRITYCISNVWQTPFVGYPDSSVSGTHGIDYLNMNYSAVAESSGIIHLAYRHIGDGCWYYSVFDPSSYPLGWKFGQEIDSYYPTSSLSMSLDSNDYLHLFYVAGTAPYLLKYVYKPISKAYGWCGPQILYTNSSSPMAHLTSWISPVEHNVLAWTQGSSPSLKLMFANFPIPFGTSGVSVSPWNREGLSPYCTYFSNLGQNVAVGSGALTVRQTIFSVQGRGGVGEDVSILYSQPRYFLKSDGTPYVTSIYPSCSLGPYWSLDLPWMDDTYVGIPGGLRFVIQWGNTGNSSVFENHDGAHFTLTNVQIRQGPPGTWVTQCFELITSDGTRYTFDGAGHQLLTIGDLRGIEQGIRGHGGYNNLTLSYSSGRLQSIRDSWLGHTTSFAYDSHLLLASVTQPDGNRTQFGYRQMSSGQYGLAWIRDQMNRSTVYSYLTKQNAVLLSGVVFPTGGKIVYSYATDNNSGTDVRSYLVTNQTTLDNTTGALIRQASFSYYVVGGNVKFANVTQLDETGRTQGRTEYVFQSVLKYTCETQKNTTGVQMGRTVTWYDTRGQPTRVDTYKGSSQSANYTEYTGYDDWGNAIFTKDALGHETYLSYANTKTSSSFQGGNLLTRVSSGRIFYDGFDNWSSSNWIKDISGTNGVVSLDGADPTNAPSLKLVKSTTKTGHTSIYHDIGTQFSDFVIEVSYMTNSNNWSSVIKGQSATSPYDRVSISSYKGKFMCLGGTAWSSMGACALNTWYSFRVLVHPSTGKYDVYIDGIPAKSTVSMGGSGAIYRLRSTAGNDSTTPSTTWVDNICVYSGLTIVIRNSAGYVAELYDSTGRLVNRARNDTQGNCMLLIPANSLFIPPGYVRMARIGYSWFDTPIMDIWGGDVYSLSAGAYSSATNKTGTGFGSCYWKIADEIWPVASRSYPAGVNEGGWSGSDYAVSGSLYHVSPYLIGGGTHYHGFNGSAADKMVTMSKWLTQYVWFTDGMLPREIMIQFYFYGSWHRAFWGGNDTGCDILQLGSNDLDLRPTMAKRMGPVPQSTNQWIQLLIPLNCWEYFNPYGGTPVTGVIYGLVDGTSRWDLTSCVSRNEITLSNLTDGQWFRLALGNGTCLTSNTANSGLAQLDLTPAAANTYPISGQLTVFDPAPDTHLAHAGSQSYGTGSWQEPGGGGMEINDMSYFNDSRFGYTSSHDRFEVWYFGFALPSNATNIRVTIKAYALSGNGDKHLNLSASPDGGACGGGTWLPFHSFVLPSRWSWVTSDCEYDWAPGQVNNIAIWVQSPDASLNDLVFVDYIEVDVTYSTSPMMLYGGPWSSEIFSGDTYRYSQPSFYPNSISGCLHHLLVGTYEYQTYSSPQVPEERYIKYDWAGDGLEQKSRIGICWVIEKSVYDSFGNRRWVIDSTNRSTFTGYSATDGYTYPFCTRNGRIAESDRVVESFENTTSWTPGGWMPPTTIWSGTLFGGYTNIANYSPTHSIQLSVNYLGFYYGTACANVSKRYEFGGPIQTLSLRMKVDVYNYSDHEILDAKLDSGLAIHLYNPDGDNYANYNYWLASWCGPSENKTPPDPHTTRVLWGHPPMNTWLNPVMHPTSDFNIDWSNCSFFVVELCIHVDSGVSNSGVYTSFRMFVDDLAFDDYAMGTTTPSVVNQYAYNSNTGLLQSSTDPMERVTNCSYDAIGRVIWTQHPDGAFTRTVYDDIYNTVTTFDESGHKKMEYFDKIGRKWKVESFAGGPSNYSWEKYTYNWQDQVASYVDSLGRITTTKYDYLGRTTKVTYPDLNYTLVTYDDYRSKITYECYNRSSGAVTHRLVKVFDYVGRLNKTLEYASSTTTYQTLMAYDAVGNLITVKDAKSQVTRMSYDSLNRLTKNTYPDGLSDNVTYDNAGREICKKDRAGNYAFTTYDFVGRVVKVASTSDTIQYVYDDAGQRLQASSNIGSISYGYNLRGMMTTLTETIAGSSTYLLAFDYNSESQLTTLYNLGHQIGYVYDALDRVTDAITGALTLVNVTYNKDNTIKTERTGSGQYTNYTYNNRGWPTSIVMSYRGVAKMSLQYKYDDVGNVVRLVNNTITERYFYDWLDRLTSASGPWGSNGATQTISYTYDAVGNRLTKNEGSTSTSYTYDSGAYNKLTSNTTGSYTWNYVYDANGNIAWKTRSDNQVKYQYSFNSLGQLTQAVKWTNGSPATLGTYWYDANGARASVTEGAVTSYYVYIGHDPICGRSNAADIQVREYVYVNGRLMAEIVGRNSYLYYFSDALGSVRQVWWSSAASAGFYVKTYKPFGVPIIAAQTTSEKTRFAGEMQDASGLCYVFARYMDPELGRFISMDPRMGKLSMPQTLDRYVYCVNAPLRYVDPTGQGSWLSEFHNWWEEHKTQIMTVAFFAIGVALAFVPGGILVTIALSAVLGGAESYLNTWAQGGSFSDCLMSGFVGAGIGGLSGAAGFAGAKLVSKIAGKYLPSAAKVFLRGAGKDVNKALYKPVSGLESRLYSGAYGVMSRVNPETNMLAPELRDMPAFFARMDAKIAGRTYSPWKSVHYAQDLAEGTIDETGSRIYTAMVEFQLGQLASYA